MKFTFLLNPPKLTIQKIIASKLLMAFALLFLSCFSLQVMGQNRMTVSGTVLDDAGLSIPGVNVSVKGTQTGVLTDIDGKYRINVNVGQTLIFSFIGYATEMKSIKKNNAKLNIIMHEESQKLDEVVVVGYGTSKRESLVSSVADVSGKQLGNTGLPNLSQAIQDALPGVIVSIPSGQPGADDASLTVRGNATFTGSNSPLILVDGNEVTGGFSQIDPQEVASISVLKDASATAVYGVRGANGVVLVTTKRGIKGKPVFSVSADVTMKIPEPLEPIVSGYDLYNLTNEAKKNRGDYSGLYTQSFMNHYLDPNRDQQLYPYVDWSNYMLKDITWENSAHINVSGGTDKVKYFTAFSYSHQGDVYNIDNKNGFYDPSFQYDKYNLRTNLDFNITKTTKLSTDISARMDMRNQPNLNMDADYWESIFKHICSASPVAFPVFYTPEFIESHPDELNEWDGQVRIAGNKDGQPNPYRELNYSGFVKTRRDVLDFSLALEQDLSFLTKGLRASARYNRSTSFTYNKTYSYSQDAFYYNRDDASWVKLTEDPNTSPTNFHPGSGESYSTNSKYTFYEGKLMYNRTFFKSHNVGAIAVFNRSEKMSSLTSFPTYHEDWIGRINYNYKEKYMLEANASYNGSEKFAPGKRFGFFPSAAVGWNIAKESFVRNNLKWINNFKVRYSMGKSGSENGDRFMYEGGWGTLNGNYVTTVGYGDPISVNNTRYGEVKIANPDASWEKAYTHNLGLDASFFNNSLSLNVDLYKEKREGIFIRMPNVSYVNAGAGTQYSVSSPPVNAGETKRHGMELSSQYKNAIGKELYYILGFNVNVAENRVIKKNDLPYTPLYLKSIGKPTQTYAVYKTAGLEKDFDDMINVVQNSFQKIQSAGSYKLQDYNGDGKIDSNDRIIQGTSQPLMTYGFNFGLSYKKLDLRVRFYGKSKCMYTAQTDYLYPIFDGIKIIARESHLDRWSPENPNAKFPSYAFGEQRTTSYHTANSEAYINCAYLRLQNVTLSYDANSDWLKSKIHLSGLTFRVTGSNLLTWSGLDYGDPEGGNGLTFHYPLARRIVFSMDVRF